MRGRPPKPLRERLLGRVQQTASGCWEYTGCRDRKGYGRLYDGRSGLTSAHRASWEVHNGPIPDGMCVCHKCDNPPCVNPNHLFLGTFKANAQDMIAKGRQPWHIGLQNRHAAKLTEEQVREIRRLASAGRLPKDLATQFNTHVVNIRLIIRRKTWKSA